MPDLLEYPITDKKTGKSYTIRVPEGSTPEFVKQAARDHIATATTPPPVKPPQVNMQIEQPTGAIGKYGQPPGSPYGGPFTPEDERPVWRQTLDAITQLGETAGGGMGGAALPGMFRTLGAKAILPILRNLAIFGGLQQGTQKLGDVLDVPPEVSRAVGDVAGLAGGFSPKIRAAVGGGFREGKAAHAAAPKSAVGAGVGGTIGAAVGAAAGSRAGQHGALAGIPTGAMLGAKVGENIHPLAFARGAAAGAIKAAAGKPWFPEFIPPTAAPTAAAPLQLGPAIPIGPIRPMGPASFPQLGPVTPPPFEPVPMSASRQLAPGQYEMPGSPAPKQLAPGPIRMPAGTPIEPIPPSRQLNAAPIWRGPGDPYQARVGSTMEPTAMLPVAEKPILGAVKPSEVPTSPEAKQGIAEEALRRAGRFKTTEKAAFEAAKLGPVRPPMAKTAAAEVAKEVPTAEVAKTVEAAVTPTIEFDKGDVFNTSYGQIIVTRTTPTTIIYRYKERLSDGTIGPSSKEELPIEDFQDLLRSRKAVKFEAPSTASESRMAGPHVTMENLYNITREIGSKDVKPTHVARWLEESSAKVLGTKVTVDQPKLTKDWGLQPGKRSGEDYGAGGKREATTAINKSILDLLMPALLKTHPEWF